MEHPNTQATLGTNKAKTKPTQRKKTKKMSTTDPNTKVGLTQGLVELYSLTKMEYILKPIVRTQALT